MNSFEVYDEVDTCPVSSLRLFSYLNYCYIHRSPESVAEIAILLPFYLLTIRPLSTKDLNTLKVKYNFLTIAQAGLGCSPPCNNLRRKLVCKRLHRRISIYIWKDWMLFRWCASFSREGRLMWMCFQKHDSLLTCRGSLDQHYHYTISVTAEWNCHHYTFP